MIVGKLPEADLKRTYNRVLNICLGIATLFQVLLFAVLRDFDVKLSTKVQKQVIIQLEQIPETRQERRPPPSVRPVVPIASENTQVSDETTIETTDIDMGLSDLAPPPVLEERVVEQKAEIVEEEEPVEIWKVEKQPEVVKQVKPDYPEIARKAKVQGQVILQAVVRKDGTVGDIQVLRSPGSKFGFDEAAIAAVRQWRYKPGLQNGKPVDVYFTIVVDFVRQ